MGQEENGSALSDASVIPEMQPNPTKLKTRTSVAGTHPKSSVSHDKPRHANGAGLHEDQDSRGRLQRYPYHLGSEQIINIDNHLVKFVYLPLLSASVIKPYNTRSAHASNVCKAYFRVQPEAQNATLGHPGVRHQFNLLLALTSGSLPTRRYSDIGVAPGTTRSHVEVPRSPCEMCHKNLPRDPKNTWSPEVQ